MTIKWHADGWTVPPPGRKTNKITAGDRIHEALRTLDGPGSLCSRLRRVMFTLAFQ